MDILLREYQEGDGELVRQFIERLQDYVVLRDPVKRIRRMSEFGEFGLKKVLEKLEKSRGRVYFAYEEEKIVGYIFGFVCDKQSEENLSEVVPTQEGQIEDVYVEEEYRGRGVGKLLMEKMGSYLKEQGCDSVWLEVFAPNSDAHDVYLKLGYMDRVIGMLKKLG